MDKTFNYQKEKVKGFELSPGVIITDENEFVSSHQEFIDNNPDSDFIRPYKDRLALYYSKKKAEMEKSV